MIYNSIIDQIGNTGLIRLSRIYEGRGNLFGKMEYLQPGGSIKDRTALRIITDAYDGELLKKGQTVVEMTSGNMGAGLAVVCGYFGNPFVAVMSDGNSKERIGILKELGASVVIVPQADGVKERVTGGDIWKAEAYARRLSVDLDAFYADQFNNLSAIDAHYRTTGPEIWEQTERMVNAFVSCIGTGSTFTGVSKFLKQQNKEIECIVVEPRNASFMKTGKINNPRHIIQGTSYGLVPAHWQQHLTDRILTVTEKEVRQTKDDLGKLEGLFVGYSSAANVAASIKYLKKINDPNAHLVTILADTGFKYPAMNSKKLK